MSFTFKAILETKKMKLIKDRELLRTSARIVKLERITLSIFQAWYPVSKTAGHYNRDFQRQLRFLNYNGSFS